MTTPHGFINVKQRSRHNIGGVETRIAVQDIRRYFVNSDGYTVLYTMDRDHPLEVLEHPDAIDQLIIAATEDSDG